MSEQRRQMGRIQFVVDDEADIDRNLCTIIVDGDGVAVSAGPDFAVVDRDRIALRQGPGGGIAGNSRSDNRKAHSKPPSADGRDTVRCSGSFSAAALRGPAKSSRNLQQRPAI